MLNDEKRQWFDCLKSFSHLNGSEKQVLIVADNADARIAEFRFRSWVKHNWPSQWHTRYKRGYIEFENGNKYDLENQTVAGKPAFLFAVTPEIDILWRRQILERKIIHSLNEMPPDDRSAAAQLIQECADPRVDIRSFGQSAPLALLAALSVSQLGGFADLFDMPGGAHKTAASPTAA
ncbi:MAG: hypothetical protein ABSH01_04850 [Terriglobia bacterium]|jgi:hypothetical protein